MAGKISDAAPRAGSGVQSERDAGSQVWVDKLGDLAEAFVGNTVQTVRALDILASRGPDIGKHVQLSEKVKARIEALEDLLVQLRKAGKA